MSIRQKLHNQKGSMVIVEATIVFPVMLFVLLFIIFIGNTYYEQAKVDDIVLRYAIKGAEYAADPYQRSVEKGEIPTDTKKIKLAPYRYLPFLSDFGYISEVEEELSKAVVNEIKRGGMIFFNNANAKVVGGEDGAIAKFENHVLYSTFVVQVEYQIKFPIRFMGESRPTIINLTSRAEVPVNDEAEFIRNVDMAVDLLQGTSFGDTISSIFKKVNGFIEKIS